VRHGDKAVGITTDDLGNTVVALRSGGRVLYGIFGIGTNPYQSVRIYGTEAGMGAHLRLSKHFRINSEIAALSLWDFETKSFNEYSARILPAARFGPFEVFAGAGFNYASYTATPDHPLLDHSSLWSQTVAGERREMRIGYKAGLQVHF